MKSPNMPEDFSTKTAHPAKDVMHPFGDNDIMYGASYIGARPEAPSALAGPSKKG